jgi:hypothetical protein
MDDQEFKKEKADIERRLRDYFNAKPRRECFLYEELLIDYTFKEVLNLTSPSFSSDIERKIRKHLSICPHCYGGYLEIRAVIRQKPTQEELQLISEKVAEQDPLEQARLRNSQAEEIAKLIGLERPAKITTRTEKEGIIQPPDNPSAHDDDSQKLQR